MLNEKFRVNAGNWTEEFKTAISKETGLSSYQVDFWH